MTLLLVAALAVVCAPLVLAQDEFGPDNDNSGLAELLAGVLEAADATTNGLVDQIRTLLDENPALARSLTNNIGQILPRLRGLSSSLIGRVIQTRLAATVDGLVDDLTPRGTQLSVREILRNLQNAASESSSGSVGEELDNLLE